MDYRTESNYQKLDTGFIGKAGEKNASTLRMGVFPESGPGLATTWGMVAKAMGIKHGMRVELPV